MLHGEHDDEQGTHHTHLHVVAGASRRSRVMPRGEPQTQGIPQGTLAVNNVRAKITTNYENFVEISGTAAGSARQRHAIRQNIIGRGAALGFDGFRLQIIRSCQYRLFALLNEPPGQHSRSVFFKVLVQQFANLFSQIRGMGQARQFVGLQCGARGGQQKFPGSLGTELRHDNLRGWVQGKYDKYSNALVIYTASNGAVNVLWKFVEKQHESLRLCSGCAGDYEEPDWTAWDDDPTEDQELTDSSDDANGGGDLRAELSGFANFPQVPQESFAAPELTRSNGGET